MSGMSSTYRSLVRRGDWFSGPSDFMSVLGLSRAEVVNCRMVRWLLDPLGHHRLGADMIRSLAEKVGCPVDAPERAAVSVEIAVDDTRADVIVEVGSRLIVIEAKIDAREEPDQAARIERLWPNADALVLLTVDGRRSPNSTSNRDRWKPLSWQWFADTAFVHMAKAGEPAESRTAEARVAVRAWATSALRSLR